MNPVDTHREQLSALIDGELDAEQARFLLRRLQHDGELAGDLERWQLAADALRGQAPALASPGFAERVAAAIGEEAAPQIDAPLPAVTAAPSSAATVAPRKPAAAQRWRWFAGGALAASLGFAAMLSLRPGAVDGDALRPTQTVAAQPATTAAPLDVAVPSPAPMPVANAVEPAVRVAETAAATPPRTAPASARVNTNATRIARTESRPAAPARAIEPPVQVAADTSAIRVADALPASISSSEDPFRQPPAKSSWPRTVLPGANSGTFNARLEQNGGYFQSQLPAQSPARIGDNP
ncbi:MAG: RseA family anti-sigma factor [Pseudomonadota bacterium]|nr:RseA family anti-sigma factor [Pseudomonadota bacterium]